MADLSAASVGYRRLAALAAPIAVASCSLVLVQFAVLALLARLGTDTLYVRSLYTPLVLLSVALTEALDISASVAAAISRGRGDGGLSTRVADFTRWGFAIIGATAVALFLAAPALATLLDVQPAVRADFVAFVRATAAAHVLTVAPTVHAGTLRGWGRPGLGALVTLTVGGIQVGGVYLLGTNLGLSSVPWATAASGLVGTGLGLALLHRIRPRPDGSCARPAGPSAGRLLGEVGVPVGLAYLLLFGVQLALTWAVSAAGPAAVSGFAIGYGVQAVAIAGALALGSATAIAMNQQRGADRPDLLAGTLRHGLWLSAGLYLPVAAAVWLVREPFASLVAGSPPVTAEAVRYLTIIGPSFAFLGPTLTALVILQQTGDGRLAIMLNLSYQTIVVAVGGGVARHLHDPTALYLTTALTTTVAVPVALAVVRARTARPRTFDRRPAAVSAS